MPNSFVRIETGVRENDVVSVHYDVILCILQFLFTYSFLPILYFMQPMIAKLVVWNETRDLALNSLIARLTEYHVILKFELFLFLKKNCQKSIDTM